MFPLLRLLSAFFVTMAIIYYLALALESEPAGTVDSLVFACYPNGTTPFFYKADFAKKLSLPDVDTFDIWYDAIYRRTDYWKWYLSAYSCIKKLDEMHDNGHILPGTVYVEIKWDHFAPKINSEQDALNFAAEFGTAMDCLVALTDDSIVIRVTQ